MTDLTRTQAQVAAAFLQEAEIINVEASVAITQGQPVTIGSDGKLDVSDGATAGDAAATRGIALKAGGAGDAIPVLKRGGLEGFDVSGLDGDAPIYVSGAAVGELADSAGGVSFQVGVVYLVPGTTEKMIYVDVPWNN